MTKETPCCESCAAKLDELKVSHGNDINADCDCRDHDHHSHDHHHHDHGHHHHHHHGDADGESLKPRLTRILVALALFAAVFAITHVGMLDHWASALGIHPIYAEFALYLIPYLIAGYDVILGAFRNIGRGQVFDEDFLMTIATFGAFALVFFPESEPHMAEGAAVMLFFQVGELFQDYAVGKSRKSISDMMDIAPEFANIMQNGTLVQVGPRHVQPGSEFIVKPGERIPLDGVVVAGASQIDTAALTGEAAPRHVEAEAEVISGCVNLTGTLTVRATRPFADSTVSRILELVEKASDKKARTENFITRFARYYTPAVVIVALLLAVLPPLALGLPWADWVQRGLIFLVVSCPCALVISVPLSFFGGIGGASQLGILVKGSNYLEVLASVDTVVFDKTGTLTTGQFAVTEVQPADGWAANGHTTNDLLRLAAHAEAFSTHPVAAAIREAYANGEGRHAEGEELTRKETAANERPSSSSEPPATLNFAAISAVEEHGGHGVSATVGSVRVLAGNDMLMAANEIAFAPVQAAGTVVYVAADGAFAGSIVVADTVKPDAGAAIAALREAGVKRTVMLTGDKAEVAQNIATELDISEFRAELLPQDKVAEVERLLVMQPANSKLAFVGDGINDAPALMRADVGIAMGAIGSDAAIEAADVVLMDDKPSNIACAVRIARKTMRIVWQNIVFALGVKLAVLALAAVGLGNMWLAVFADVGVAVLAILNATRAMRVR